MGNNTMFKKINGIYYTDSLLAKKMVELLDIDYSCTFSLIEPAVGTGHILTEVVRKYLEHNVSKTNSEVKQFLENNIVAFDKNSESIEICVTKLNEVLYDYRSNVNVKWSVEVVDIVVDDIEKWNRNFDYVIGNPPYVTKKNISETDRIKIKDTSRFCKKFNFDLYYYFFEIAINLWNRSGKIVYITPNTFLRAKSASELRTELIDNKYIECIIDFEDELLFEDASTYTAISVLSNNNTQFRVYYGSFEELELKRILYKEFVYDQMNVDKIKNTIYTTEVRPNGVTLGEIAEVRNGLATLNDKVFVIELNEIKEINERFTVFVKNNTERRIESDLLMTITRSREHSRATHVIFPYILMDNSLIKLIDWSMYPLTYRYLSESLSDEYKKKYDVFWGRTQGIRNYRVNKIVIPKVALLERGCFIIKNKGFIRAGLSIVINEEYQDKTNVIMNYLNSDDVLAYLSLVSKNYSSGYKSISSADLKAILIPLELLEE